MAPLHVAHIQASMSPEHGGPTKSLANYCQAQSRAGHRVSIWTLEGYPNASDAIRLPEPIENHVFRTRPPLQLGRSPDLRAGLRTGDTVDLYHLHGTWSLAMAYGSIEARFRGRPYIVELMGMYESWCLRRRWLKKRLVRWWFQDRILREAACLHVNSNQEAIDLNAMGFRRPIAVIPVGVDTDTVAAHAAQLPSESPWSELAGERAFILYFSRIHPKKGLDMLIRCWAQLSPRHPGLRLVIAGTGSPKYVDECRQLALELGVAGSCVWTGHVDEIEKAWLMSHAHCFVLPTHSENFGNTVAEALAHSIPVITTTRTPWSDLVQHHCGWQVPDTVEGIRSALEEAIAMSPATRRTMGDNGSSLVRRQYSLDSVVAKMLALYEWTLGKGQKPDCLAY